METTTPALPFTVGADRDGARRRAWIAWPVLLLLAVVVGVAAVLLPVLVTRGPAGLSWLVGVVAVAALAAFPVVLPHTRRPPEDDWLFRLEADGLRFPPGRQAHRAMPGHPGLLLPWSEITTLRARKLGGDPVVLVGVTPAAEGVLLAQSETPERARLAVAKGFRLRVAHGAVDPAECLRLITATREAHVGDG